MMRAILAVLALAGIAWGAVAQEAPPDAAPAWDAETLSVFARIPVQDRGRVKPLNTVARFTLLQISGKKTFEDESGTRHSALEWFLDALYHPAQAARHRVFVIDNPEVMEALGLPYVKPRDRYAYATLAPVRSQIFAFAQEAAHVEGQARTRVQSQLLQLAQNVHDYEKLAVFLGFARRAYVFNETDIPALAPFAGTYSFAEVAAMTPDIMQTLTSLHGTEHGDIGLGLVTQFYQAVEGRIINSDALALIPPLDSAEPNAAWLTPVDLFSSAIHGVSPAETQLEVLRLLEETAHQAESGDMLASAQSLEALIRSKAEARDEYGQLPLEVTFYRASLFGFDLFFTGVLILYVLAFLTAAASWLAPRSRIMTAVACAVLAVPFVLHVCGISMRSIIRNRPPVTTLYETLLFLGATAVFLALFTELVNRRKIAVSVGAFLGVAGMFLANRYEAIQGTDTMPMLVAVLDTNFWLWTHVTTTIIGYGAGFFAGALAHVYLFAKAFKIKRAKRSFYATLSRMTYGMLCFSLLFVALGTILGGIWANESWGRFWGWDPKENGALMIVLWQLVALHAYAGGLIGRHGLNMAAVVGNIVIAFCWFGVNLLGVGLHSYGFTSGVQHTLIAFYLAQSAVLLVGAIGWLREDQPPQGPKAQVLPAESSLDS